MRIDPKEGMDIAYYLGLYEPALVRLIDLLVRPGDVAVDIGTHKGYMTLSLAHAVGRNGWVIAFDPDPRVFSEMSANCERNGFHQVKKFPCALGDSRGLCEFSLSSRLGNSSRFPNDIAKPTVTSVVSVEVKTLDEVLEDINVPMPTNEISFMKIDAEGSEPLILRGMQETLTRHHPAIYMEINRGSLGAAGLSVMEIQASLEMHRYSFYKVMWGRNALFRGFLSLEPLVSLESERTLCYEVLAINKEHREWDKIQNMVKVKNSPTQTI